MLVHLDLHRSSRVNLVSYGNFSKAMSLNIQTHYFAEIHRPYGQSWCKYVCDPLIKSHNFCYCSDDVETLREYMCNRNDVLCLYKLCLGYKCKNGQCLLNNVRCNSVDECGDSTDEILCTKTCRASEHLCKGKCIPRHKICDEVTYKYPIMTNKGVFRNSSYMANFNAKYYTL
ncbi:Prolow-density lipoprotein receptor-related protein 1 [Thelohanellus kitauei]|uniref:Prolow-density lipoprotein receptor-related protein 1 n=1 Tax=Thelohanellus kitauei TaxID=669202 RepID=A0A0C2M7N9_THEKT|nr:Prolow-density lipoprotein receptor-related protein 1 [Thelohanellus kitauei]